VSKRIEALYDQIPAEASSVADIGYDLGHLLVSLVARRRDVRALGIEIQPAAKPRFLTAHAEFVASHGERIALREGDGLGALHPGEVEGAIIAGVGARTIARMIDEAPAVVASLEWLLLCPARFQGEVRPALARAGLFAASERLVEDRGHLYEVILARHGEEPCPDPAARAYGPRLFEGPDPLLAAYLAHVRRCFAGALANDLASYGPDSPNAALGAKLRLLSAAEALAARSG